MLIKPFLGKSVLSQLEVDFKVEMGVHEVFWEMVLWSTPVREWGKQD